MITMRKRTMQANEFLLNKQRMALINNVSHEYLSIIAILYGDQIETGVRRIQHYRNMTMLEAENEIRIRSMMVRGQRMNRKRQLRKEHEDSEQAMLEELKRSKG